MVFPRLEDPGFARAFAGVCAIVTAVALGTAALVYLFRLVLLVLLACVLAELFSTIADPLARRLPGPRGIYVAFALLLVLSAFAGLVTLLVVPLTDQAGLLADELPRLVARVERFVDGNVVQPSSPARDSVQEAVTERLPAFAVSGLTGAASILEGAFDVLGAVFFAFFLALSPEAHREGLLSLVPARLAPR
ncbi:MAG TPA: AI-2E family transporter, partial [Planctomycetota bacterium]|nr:AI-2E family transporter [Planctomycetota bacterium]